MMANPDLRSTIGTVGNLTKMPAPADGDLCAGPAAFTNTANVAGTNFNAFTPWSSDVADKVGRGISYTGSVFTPTAGWAINSFSLLRMNCSFQLDAILTYSGTSFASAANCLISGVTVGTFTSTNFGAPSGSISYMGNSRLNNVGAVVSLNVDQLAIYSAARPSFTFASGVQLYIHARYYNRYYDSMNSIVP